MNVSFPYLILFSFGAIFFCGGGESKDMSSAREKISSIFLFLCVVAFVQHACLFSWGQRECSDTELAIPP